MKKRILSLLMVLVLCFSLVPAEALAEESESAAPAAEAPSASETSSPADDGKDVAAAQQPEAPQDITTPAL